MTTTAILKPNVRPWLALPKYSIQYRGKSLDLSQPRVMGILNVTPDSFSDGGEFTQLDCALRHCEQMLQDGASIIDVGGESTRPNADRVSPDEERQRVIPIVTAIRQRFGSEVWLSIDTSNPEIMAEAVSVGADIWNDVRALKRAGAVQMAAKLQVPVMLMHMRGEPDTMSQLAHYDDVVAEVMAELTQRVDSVVDAGVRSDNIIIDPGFGFAKNYSQHCQLLTQLQRLTQLDLPLMFAVSRKRFLGEVLTHSGVPTFMQHEVKDRDPVGMAAALLALQQGACIIRTHNVAMTTQAVTLWQQLLNSQTS